MGAETLLLGDQQDGPSEQVLRGESKKADFEDEHMIKWMELDT